MFSATGRAPFIALLTSVLLLAPAWTQAQDSPYAAAAAYSRTHRGDAVLVMKGDSVVFEEYQNGYAAATPHMLASGSKSFTCAIAVRGMMDGKLRLDEPVARTITEWADDTVRRRITVRQLLDLSSGMGGGVTGFDGGPIRRTRRADAIRTPLVATPGTQFNYGPSNFDVFGELMRRKLGGETPDAYLLRTVLQPIGLTGLEWRRDRDGMPMLPGGGFTTAREWVKYGRLIRDHGRWDGRAVLDSASLAQCTTRSGPSRSYGLTFWLSSDASSDLAARRVERGLRAPRKVDAPIPVIMAAGAGIQRLYVLREQDLVVVRFGQQDPRWSDTRFLELVLGTQRGGRE